MEPKPTERIRDLVRDHGYEKVFSLLAELPELERAVLALHLSGVGQIRSAELLGISQPSVCYRLKSAGRALQFLLTRKEIDPDQFRSKTSGVLAPEDAELVLAFLETSNQSRVATRLGLTQGAVRYRLLKAAASLRAVPDLREYAEVIEETMRNPRLAGSGRTHPRK